MPSVAVSSPVSTFNSQEKKRKASELTQDDNDVESGTSSKLVEPVGMEEKSKKKANLASDSEEAVTKEENPLAVSNFRIPGKLREKRKEKGIETLFPIQAMTFDTILDGSDVVGRARTGQACNYLYITLIY